MPEANRALFLCMVRAFATGDVSDIASFVSEDYVDHQAARGPAVRGPDGFVRLVGSVRARFPDLQAEAQLVIAAGDSVAARIVWRGTYRKPGKTTPEPFSAESIDIVRFEGGKAVEHWGVSAGWPS